MKTTTQTTSSRIRSEEGQAIVEFAIVAPLLALLLAGIIQFGVAFRDYLAITDAVRVGARAAAVNRTNDPCGATGAAKTAILNTLSPGQQSRVIFPTDWCTAGPDLGDPVTITIKYPYSIGVGSLSESGDLKASATERLE
jgi:TadE-like protein